MVVLQSHTKKKKNPTAPCDSDIFGSHAEDSKTIQADKSSKGGCMKHIKAKRLQKVSSELMRPMKNTLRGYLTRPDGLECCRKNHLRASQFPENSFHA